MAATNDAHSSFTRIARGHFDGVHAPPVGRCPQGEIEEMISWHQRPCHVVIIKRSCPIRAETRSCIKCSYEFCAVEISAAIDEDAMFGQKLHQVATPSILVEHVTRERIRMGAYECERRHGPILWWHFRWSRGDHDGNRNRSDKHPAT